MPDTASVPALNESVPTVGEPLERLREITSFVPPLPSEESPRVRRGVREERAAGSAAQARCARERSAADAEGPRRCLVLERAVRQRLSVVRVEHHLACDPMGTRQRDNASGVPNVVEPSPLPYG
jgi:hypothetical protein